MTEFFPGVVILADLRDPDDLQGRSYREVNAAMQHDIPIGALVEITSDDEASEYTGIRLYVVAHGRDCDETPLYLLGAKGGAGHLKMGGFSADSLIYPIPPA